jgi:hypothetical protein
VVPLQIDVGVVWICPLRKHLVIWLHHRHGCRQGVMDKTERAGWDGRESVIGCGRQRLEAMVTATWKELRRYRAADQCCGGP